MITTRVSIHINRPLPQVYDFLMDLDNYPLWQNGLAQVSASAGLSVGSMIKFTQVGLGQSFDLIAEVIENDGHSKFVVASTQGPITFTSTYKLEGAGQETHLEVINDIETSLLFKLAEPVLQTMSNNRYQSDLESLKVILESQE